MAGIYIHIPFCRQACRYCDFHFNVSLGYKKEMVDSIIKEIGDRRNDLDGEIIETIYFGGGTPSVLEFIEIKDIFSAIYTNHKLSEEPEISFEANPDDLNPDYLNILRESGINRLSIGIQSFFDRDLKLMRRIHTAQQSIQAIKDSRKAGFTNISIDLIYGLPGQEEGEWEENLNTALESGIQHISAYHLTYEPRTVFDHWRKKGKLTPIGEDQSLRQFETLIKKTSERGFDHYEISNFALAGFISKHNSNYWNQVNYIGVGPSSHSYNGKRRRWNIANNLKYMQAVKNGDNSYYDFEDLTLQDLYNEYMLTSLRTSRGADLTEISKRFGIKYLDYIRMKAPELIGRRVLEENDNKLKLSDKGIFIADFIIAEFFVV